MADLLEFDVSQDIRGAMHEGRLRIQSENISFRNKKTGKQDVLTTEDIKNVKWLQRAKGHCLKIVTEKGDTLRFDGFRETEYEKLSSCLKRHYEKELDKVDLSVRGWNWGVADFVEDSLDFRVHGKTAFEIPLRCVSRAVAGKNECTMEFHTNEEQAVSLAEMRFYIPNSDDADVDSVNDFCDNVLKKANIMQITGDVIAIFSEISSLTPRGRYDVKVYSTFLQLHGKTFDYKIPFTSIVRLFLLPHRDQRQMFFVISLDPPIKQGQTRYHFLIFLFNKDDETSLELGVSEEECKEKYGDKLQKEMNGLEYEVVAKVMKALTNHRVTIPGSFHALGGAQCLSCSHKAVLGFLYPLEKGFIFVHKPSVHVRFDEIASVNFARSSGSNRSFDFEIMTKEHAEFHFTALDKDEYQNLYDFVKGKNLLVKNRGIEGSQPAYQEMYSDDSGDDRDHYLQKVKKEGRERDVVDSEDEEDEEFLPENFHTVEPDEEWDSELSEDSEDEISGSDSDAERRREEKRKEKQRRAEKRKKRDEKEARKEREGGGGRKKSGKKRKDPNAPKRPQTAYFAWLGDNRERIKEENPGISLTDIAKKGGEEWKNLDSSTKKKYDDQYHEAILVYKREMENYEPGAEGDSGDDKKKNKKKPASTTTSGSGANFKSKEYIEDSSSSSMDSDDEPLSKKTKAKKSDSGSGDSD